MAVYDGPFFRKEDRSLAHNGEVQPLQLGIAVQCTVMNTGEVDLTLSDASGRKELDNTVGSWGTHFWEKYPQHCYAFGLWCADGYHRTSSIGLTSVNEHLIGKFREFLLSEFPSSRLRLRIYYPHGRQPDADSFRAYSTQIVMYPMRKLNQYALQLYVNCRPLLRMIQKSRNEVEQMTNTDSIMAYFAGRFDGDGSVASDGRKFCRIVYSSREEAEKDKAVVAKIGINASVYEYKAASEWCLYIPRSEAGNFLKLINRYSYRA